MKRFVVEYVAKRIAGDIVFSGDVGEALRKWRELFGVTQSELARAMGVSPSVLSEYERGKRVPGTRFVRRFVEALIRIDEARGFEVIKRLAGALYRISDAVIDLREFENPLSLDEIVTAVEGYIVNTSFTPRPVFGYTIIDAIAAIVTMRGNDFWLLMGMTTERALIFTNVSSGRSPLVAVRVAPVKPAAVVIHGPRKNVDTLAIVLADVERIPLIVSTADRIEDVAEKLRKLAA